MWLSGLHIPESYLTALVQAACRKNEWPLDKSDLFTEVTSYDADCTDVEKLSSGCYVTGLYLEGAAWDHGRSCLKRQNPKMIVESLPLLKIIPVEVQRLKTQGSFKTPVYVTQRRRNAMVRHLCHTSGWGYRSRCVCVCMCVYVCASCDFRPWTMLY